jgi:hypothetical protein
MKIVSILFILTMFVSCASRPHSRLPSALMPPYAPKRQVRGFEPFECEPYGTELLEEELVQPCT